MKFRVKMMLALTAYVNRYSQSKLRLTDRFAVESLVPKSFRVDIYTKCRLAKLKRVL